MGLGDHGDDPVALAQAWSPCARIHAPDQDIPALVVPGGAGIEAQFNRVGLRASDRTAAVSSIEEAGDSRSKQLQSAREGNEGEVRPIETMRPVLTVPGQPDERVFGSK